jgi:hypothetical protein
MAESQRRVVIQGKTQKEIRVVTIRPVGIKGGNRMRTTLACMGLGLGLLVVACGSAPERDGFDETTPAGGNNAPSGGQNDNGSLGDGTPPPEPPKQPEECTKMDIVFVVDDSGSMAEEQNNLATNFPKFVQKIESFKTKGGSKLDWRLAVTTTARNVKYNIQTPLGAMGMSEKGDDGAFRKGSGCGGSKAWIDMGDANAEGTFQCRANAGTGGSSIEMPLEALKLSLVDRVADGTNAGFLRPDALLAFVVLTDEDDCSRSDNNFTIQNDRCDTMQGTNPVSHYKTVLDGIAQGEGRWAAAVIAGQTQCKSSFGDAIEAKRLKEFTSLPGVKSTFSSICDGDLSLALDKALDLFDGACKSLPPATVK